MNEAKAKQKHMWIIMDNATGDCDPVKFWVTERGKDNQGQWQAGEATAYKSCPDAVDKMQQLQKSKICDDSLELVWVKLPK